MRLWNHVGAEKSGIHPGSKYLAIDDPTDLYVAAPERGGIKLGGCVVERDVEDVMQQVIDRGLFRCKNYADIVRTAVTHFVMDQLHPALETHPYRFRAYSQLLRLQAKIYRDDETAKMLSTAESIYLARPEHRRAALSSLDDYANSLVEEGDIIEARDRFKGSSVLGPEFDEYLRRPRIVDPEQEEFEREVRDRELTKREIDDSEAALNALAQEQDQ